MTETTLYEKLLGIERPWRVRDVRLALEQGDVEVGVEFEGDTLVCPACGAACPGYDRRPRVWRHLDTMQYRTLVRAEVPRVRCAKRGVQQVRVPWAEAQSRFTALFEAMVIDWLRVASFAAVARQCRLSWDQADPRSPHRLRQKLGRTRFSQEAPQSTLCRTAPRSFGSVGGPPPAPTTEAGSLRAILRPRKELGLVSRICG